MTNTVLYIDLFSGAAGDMLLGALIDAGLSLASLQVELQKMPLSGYELEAERQVRHGVSGTKLHVHELSQTHPARHLSDVRRLLRDSALSDRIRETSLAVFQRLARVEARIHGVEVEHVHFHELSAVDSLVDIVGFVAGLGLLGVDRVFSSPVPLGSGSIQTAHGLIPVPVPATLALLAEVGAPTRPHQAQTEIVTPTGAALLAEMATFERPAMRITTVGYGFGSKQFAWINGLRAWIGEAGEQVQEGRDQVVLLQCNLDDATGETLGFAMERLFDTGALDVWFQAAQMKKNRPAIVLSVLARSGQAEGLAHAILHETSTLGVRMSPSLERMVAERRVREVETPWGKVRVKEKWLAGERAAISPEYDDCARIARERSIPLGRVFDAAIRATE